MFREKRTTHDQVNQRSLSRARSMGETKQRATPPRVRVAGEGFLGARSEPVAQPATHDVGGHPIAKVDAVRKDGREVGRGRNCIASGHCQRGVLEVVMEIFGAQQPVGYLFAATGVQPRYTRLLYL